MCLNNWAVYFQFKIQISTFCYGLFWFFVSVLPLAFHDIVENIALILCMLVPLFVSLFVCQSVYVCVSASLSGCRFLCLVWSLLSVCLSVRLFPFVCLYVCMYACLFVVLSLWSFFLFACVQPSPSVWGLVRWRLSASCCMVVCLSM